MILDASPYERSQLIEAIVVTSASSQQNNGAIYFCSDDILRNLYFVVIFHGPSGIQRSGMLQNVIDQGVNLIETPRVVETEDRNASS